MIVSSSSPVSATLGPRASAESHAPTEGLQHRQKQAPRRADPPFAAAAGKAANVTVAVPGATPHRLHNGSSSLTARARTSSSLTVPRPPWTPSLTLDGLRDISTLPP